MPPQVPAAFAERYDRTGPSTATSTAGKARLRKRNAAGTHAFVVNDAEFDEIRRYFVPPSAQEGFETVVYLEAPQR